MDAHVLGATSSATDDSFPPRRDSEKASTHVKKPVITDLTKTEGDPGSRASVLVDQERERVSLEARLPGGTRLAASAPAWTPSGIAPALVLICVPGLVVTTSFIVLGLTVSAPGWLILTSALAAFAGTATIGLWLINRFARRPVQDTTACCGSNRNRKQRR